MNEPPISQPPAPQRGSPERGSTERGSTDSGDEPELASRAREVIAFRAFEGRTSADRLAHEEPLEIQVQGASLAVLMRTPGEDEDLALGFLISEGLIRSAADVASIRHCPSVKDPEAEENILRVVLRAGVEIPVEKLRQRGFASTSCGLCGKATIESALVETAPIESALRLSLAALYRMPAQLRSAQRGFDATGGLHAAGLFSVTGELLLAREDVGRHNAVDKIIGGACRASVEAGACCLLVSGRTSFEIIQKAAVARIPLVAGISAPSSLAARYAEAAGITLLGFLRGETVNAYSRVDRLTDARLETPRSPS